jgi:hypothetical protein
MCAAALRVRNEKHGAIEANPARPRIETLPGLPEGRRFSAVAISKPRRKGSKPKARTGEAADPRPDRGWAAKCPLPRPRLRCARRVYDLPDHLAGRTRRSSFQLRATSGRCFIGHCNVRSSLNVAGEFSTSKKTPPVPENFRRFERGLSLWFMF